MFQWNAEKVRFMEDAAAWGDFHARLAAELAPYLPRNGHVCDAGCGTGHLALALSPYVKRVTAVDVSAQALALLTENCRKRGAANIDIRCGDIARLPPEQPYDAMVFCFFGHIEEILTISAAQCRGTVLAVMRNDGCHRFSAAQGAVRHGGYPRGAAELTARGIPFHAVERELPIWHRTGTILRRDLWKVFPEWKEKFFQNIDHIFRLLVKLSSGIGQHQFLQTCIIGNGLPSDVALFLHEL